MSHLDNISQSIQRIAHFGRPAYGEIVEAICHAVDKESATMSVRFYEGGKPFEGVKLQLHKAEHKILLIPKVGCNVLLLCISSNQNNLFCVAAEEYEDIEFSVGGKFTLKSGEADLKEIFDKLLTTLKNFVVLTSQGQSVGLSPKSIQEIEAIDKELKKFFE